MSENTSSRREFLKLTVATAGGLALASFGAPFVFGEKSTFDPNNSYWAAEQPNPNPPLRKNIRVDVAIIGGGYTGLSAAYHLARANPKARIVVLEARRVGNGASGRNGGMVLPHIGPETMQIVDDPLTHKWVYDVTVASMQDLARLVRRTGADCDLKLDGYLYTVTKGEDVTYYREYVQQANELGMPLQFFNRLETAERLGTKAYWCSVYDPNGGQVHPMKLVRALKTAAEGAGVYIYEDSPVHSLEEGEALRLLVGDAGFEVIAEAVVLATNGYTSKLGWFQHQVIPVHTQCLSTEPLNFDQLTALAWNSRLPFYDSRYLLYHLMLTDDNRIVIGGGMPAYFFNNGVHYIGDLEKVAETILTELTRIYPAMEGVQVDSVWDGILGISYDEYEAVGVTGEYSNIYYGLAYNGHGINLSFLFGKVIADLYRGEVSRWEEMPFFNYPLSSFPPEPLRWLGAQGMLAYYRNLDNA